MASESKPLNGIVKWYNVAKGYGFIKVEGRDKDIFFHAKQWMASAMATLPIEGETVQFVLNEGPKGSFATQMQRPTAETAAHIPQFLLKEQHAQ